MTSDSPHTVSFGCGSAGSCSAGESVDARNVTPSGGAFGSSWRQHWWDYVNHPAAPCRHGHLKAKNNKLVPQFITHKHVHMQMSACVFTRGWRVDEPVTVVEWWHFCGISCLSLNICDTRLALESRVVCLCVYVCVCVDVHKACGWVYCKALGTNKQLIKALSLFPPPLLACQPTRLWDMLGATVPVHSNYKLCPCLPSSRSHLGLLITALNFLLLTHCDPCPP